MIPNVDVYTTILEKCHQDIKGSVSQRYYEKGLLGCPPKVVLRSVEKSPSGLISIAG
jgi:hypothetical protein